MKSVKLVTNKTYPTYQLYVQMASTKTSPADGLKIAVATTLAWLDSRLGENAPSIIKDVADEIKAGKNPKELPEEKLFFSKHFTQGYNAEIVYVKDKNQWSLQINEPDLGSNPGNPNQSRPPVPGRSIESDIEFRIVQNKLECGFKTVITEPEGHEPVEVYRFAIIKKLIENPAFGLTQVMPLSEDASCISTKKELESFISLWKNPNNQLPMVIFCERRFEIEDLIIDNKSSYSPLDNIRFSIENNLLSEEEPENEKEMVKVGYDVNSFAKSCVGYARTFILSLDLKKRFEKETKLDFKPGSIIVMHPNGFGETEIISYKKNEKKRLEGVEELRQRMHVYPRGKEINYGHITFISVAKDGLRAMSNELLNKMRESSDAHAMDIESLNKEWQKQLDEMEERIEKKDSQIEGLRDYQHKLEDEKSQIMREAEKAKKKLKKEIQVRDEMIGFLERKFNRPKTLPEIPNWLAGIYGERVFFHDKAIALLNDKSTTVADMDKLCDALEYLASEYWEVRYEGLSEDESNNRCSKKYGKPFDVTHQTELTIEAYPSEYKIKYFEGPNGKKKESALNYHLRAGNDSEFLIRIYFLHDDEKKKIVIGSLPKHLSTNKIK